MKALVTGGAGFIGSHIAEELIKEKAEVRVLDNLSAGKMENIPAKGIEFIKGDITDRSILDDVLKDVDYVFHEAAQTSAAYSFTHPKTTWDINIRGTKLLLNAAVKAGIKRFIFASSHAVYGNALPPLKEAKDTKPVSPLGDSKRMGELLMQEYHEKEGLDTVSLRYFNVYGPGEDADSAYSGVISRFINRLSKGKKPAVYGSGSQTRDFIFVDDAAHANILAMKAGKTKAESYNIATGSALSVNELLKILKSALGSGIEPEFEPEKPGDIKYSFADVEKAKEHLGFEAKTSIESGLKKTIAYYTGEKT